MSNNGRRFNNNNRNNNRRFNNNNHNRNNNNRRFNNNVDDESVNISPQQRRNFENKHDQYIAKAKDALSKGDKVEAENFFQHADHYFRMMNLGLPPRSERNNQERNYHENGSEQQVNQASDVSVEQAVASNPADDISSLPFLQEEIKPADRNIIE